MQLYFRNIIIYHSCRGIYDAEVHPCFYGVIEEDGVHRLTEIVVATKRETQVADAPTDVCTGQVLTYPFRRTDEVGCIGIMLFHTCGDGEDIGVENDVQRIHPHPFGQYLISPLGYLNPTFIAGGLPLLVEAHHHHSSSIAHGVFSMGNELRLALFQRDGVDDALALHTFQARLDHLPVAGVNHHRHLGDIGLCCNHIEEGLHLLLGVEQPVVHIDINHEGPVLHLLTGDGHSLVVVPLLDQSQEFPRASYVTPFTNVGELHRWGDVEQFEA